MYATLVAWKKPADNSDPCVVAHSCSKAGIAWLEGDTDDVPEAIEMAIAELVSAGGMKPDHIKVLFIGLGYDAQVEASERFSKDLLPTGYEAKLTQPRKGVMEILVTPASPHEWSAFSS